MKQDKIDIFVADVIAHMRGVDPGSDIISWVKAEAAHNYPYIDIVAAHYQHCSEQDCELLLCALVSDGNPSFRNVNKFPYKLIDRYHQAICYIDELLGDWEKVS